VSVAPEGTGTPRSEACGSAPTLAASVAIGSAASSCRHFIRANAPGGRPTTVGLRTLVPGPGTSAV
jgi:hypothetical protein